MGLQLRTTDGTVIDAPATLKAITTFILFEQEKWFEKELEFLLAWVKPGMEAIDIGANLGVYGLPLARHGVRVTAYEPGSEARAHLQASCTLNRVPTLEISGSAVSDSVRNGRLVIDVSSEANRLGDEGNGEQVPVTSLDHEDARRNWSPGLIKVDAEGEELRIIDGGARFFARHSPLVMFEVRTGTSLHADAVRALGDRGYRTYRSIPSAPLLVPCEVDDRLDPYELNLFAAKQDRGAMLAAQGYLIETIPRWTPDGAARESGIALVRTQPFAVSTGMHDKPMSRVYTDALAGYAAWRISRSYGALDFAVATLSELCEAEPNIARLSSLARMASEAGARATAVKSLEALSARLKKGDTATTEPFWPASACAELVALSPQTAEGWFIAQALEQEERLARYSSYWGSSDINLEWLAAHPWIPTEMLRRHALAALRVDHRAAIPERLCRPAPDHLNARLWQSGLVRFAARNQ